MSLYESHEVLGTDLPIFREKADNYYSLEDILNSFQSPEDFQRCGYVQVFKYNRTFLKPIFKIKFHDF